MEEAQVSGAVVPATLDQIRGYLEQALRFDGSGVMAIDDFAGMQLFACVDGKGQIIGGYALSLATWGRGKVAWIMGAGSANPKLDFMRSFLPVVQAQAKAMGATRLHLLTVRPGLVKRFKGMGYRDSGTVLGIDL